MWWSGRGGFKRFTHACVSYEELARRAQARWGGGGGLQTGPLQRGRVGPQSTSVGRATPPYHGTNRENREAKNDGWELAGLAALVWGGTGRQMNVRSQERNTKNYNGGSNHPVDQQIFRPTPTRNTTCKRFRETENICGGDKKGGGAVFEPHLARRLSPAAPARPEFDPTPAFLGETPTRRARRRRGCSLRQRPGSGRPGWTPPLLSKAPDNRGGERGVVVLCKRKSNKGRECDGMPSPPWWLIDSHSLFPKKRRECVKAAGQAVHQSRAGFVVRVFK